MVLQIRAADGVRGEFPRLSTPLSLLQPQEEGSRLPSTARSMMAGRVFLVLTGACQFGHGVGGFTTNFIHSPACPAYYPGKVQIVLRPVSHT